MKHLNVFLCLFFSCCLVWAEGLTSAIATRPLRSLDIGSTVVLQQSDKLIYPNYFQDGQAKEGSSVDVTRPYCNLRPPNFGDELPELTQPLTLEWIGGQVMDEETAPNYTAFETYLRFSHAKGTLKLECRTPSINAMNEMTLEAFESVFKGHLKWGNLVLKPTDLDPTPSNVILDARVLRERLSLRVKNEIVLKPSDASGLVLAWNIQAQRSIPAVDEHLPYCSLSHSQPSDTLLPFPNEVRIPTGTTLQFTGIVNQFYRTIKQGLSGPPNGFYFEVQVFGAAKPLTLSCFNNKSEVPITLSDLRKMSPSEIDWVLR